MILLSILIPCLKSRMPELYRICGELQWQADLWEHGNGSLVTVEILINLDNREKTTGKKRQELIEEAGGKYVCFVDSDDDVDDDYIAYIMRALLKDPDVVGFKGRISTDGHNQIPWSISKDHEYTSEMSIKGTVSRYLRPNNHLSPVKREIALQIGYPDKTFGEDYEYCIKLKNSGLVKSEIYIDKELYHYQYISQK